jgi:HEAT repeat protein
VRRSDARLAWALCAALFAGSAAWAGDSKDAPAEEDPEEAAVAAALEKKLEASNKVEVGETIEQLGGQNNPSARRVLIKYICGTSNSEYGAKAVRALGKKGSAGVVDFLCGPNGARSTRVLVAEAGCRALADVGDRRAVPTLLECMKADKTVVVCAAIEAAVHLDPKAEGLADRLGSLAAAKDDMVRMSCATALGELTSPKAVTSLIALAKDSNSIVRMNACRSIERLAPYEARKVMEEVSTKDKNREVREAAARALAALPKEPPPAPPAPPKGGK